MAILKKQVVDFFVNPKNVETVTVRRGAEFGIVRYNGWELGVTRRVGYPNWNVIPAFKQFFDFPRKRDVIRRALAAIEGTPVLAKKTEKPKIKSTWVDDFNNSRKG